MQENLVRYDEGEESRDEEARLFQAYQITKDKNLRNILAEKYLYIAEIMAKKFANKGVEYNDLFQVSSLALLKAIERFDSGKGLKFSTFATPSIIGELKNYFRDKSRLIKPGRKNSLMILKIKNAAAELSIKNSKPPTAEEIASHIGSDIDSVIEAMEYNSSVVSLDQSIDGSDVSLYEVIPDTEDVYEKFDDRQALAGALEKLSADERKLITQRFSQNKSQAEIAKEMNVSQMFVSRLEKKIIAKLKKAFEIP